jgi:prepilin-type N-terminal cleavage/methylation domain-containing protein
MTLRPFRSARAFTLIEIMIVVLIVGILSLLAMVAIGRIKEKAARTLVTNNLRQIYNAKEYYFAETGKGGFVRVAELWRKNYVTRRLAVGLFDYGHAGLDLQTGWHYPADVYAGEPTMAYKGVLISGSPTGEVIYYPAPPRTASAAGSGGGSRP